MIAVLLGCGLRRAELATVTLEHLQQREEHWVFADMVGKGGHVRTIPIPAWVAAGLQAWITAADLGWGTVVPGVKETAMYAAQGFSPKGVWGGVKGAFPKCGSVRVGPADV